MAKTSEHSLELRKAVVAHLLASQAGTMVGGRVYGETPPAEVAMPFIRYGAPIATPFDASRIDGTEHRVTIHGFAEGPFSDAAHMVGNEIEVAMSLLPEYEVEQINFQMLQDGRDWHALCEFTVKTLEITA